SPDARERLRALGYVASSAQTTPSGNEPNPASTIASWNAFEEALSATAVPPFARLASAHPDAPVFQTTYARALKDAGRTKEALAAYRKAALRWPTDAALRHDLAATAREAGSLDEAVKADQAALALAPRSATARNGLGLLAIDQRRPADAVREFTQATDLD